MHALMTSLLFQQLEWLVEFESVNTVKATKLIKFSEKFVEII